MHALLNCYIHRGMPNHGKAIKESFNLFAFPAVFIMLKNIIMLSRTHENIYRHVLSAIIGSLKTQA